MHRHPRRDHAFFTISIQRNYVCASTHKSEHAKRNYRNFNLCKNVNLEQICHLRDRYGRCSMPPVRHSKYTSHKYIDLHVIWSSDAPFARILFYIGSNGFTRGHRSIAAYARTHISTLGENKWRDKFQLKYPIKPREIVLTEWERGARVDEHLSHFSHWSN